ncbi:MAG TPA: hypothetical protein PKA13_15575 [Geminicoccaceae bacterium]|nr:hypothetical protein [Geminicoccus sp.]HMU51194.1 hypothetical protein [Geminicoccaceae bacterium]
MRDVFAIFFRADGTRPWLVLLCLAMASLAEGIGEKGAEISGGQRQRVAMAWAVVVVSHRPEFMDIADRIYRVEAGRVELVPLPAVAAGSA